MKLNFNSRIILVVDAEDVSRTDSEFYGLGFSELIESWFTLMEIAENIPAFLGRTTEQISNAPRSLDILPIGTTARVTGVSGSGAIARRLLEMGVVPGAPVRVIKAAPLGDPIEIRVRGYHLALRRTEARTILVTTRES